MEMDFIMKKFFVFAVVAVIGLFVVMAVPGAHAAPAAATAAGPYEGVFHGTVYAPNGSKAPMSLNLTHRGNVVEGTVFLGEGLSFDAGVCGSGSVPASTVVASGNSSASNPKALTASSTFDVQGMDIKADLESYVSGDNLNAEVKIDLPWFCGGDPVLTGQLFRAA
jgi:hypothetical protein